MSTEIFYFSGTGNSLYVAKELQKLIPDTQLIPMVKQLPKEVIKTEAEVVGFVFPVHALTLPIPVRKFLKKIDLRSRQFVFAVATRLGLVFNDFKKVDRLLKKQRKRLDSHFLINMYSNDVKFENYQTPTPQEIQKIESNVNEQLDAIANIILNRERSLEKDTDYLIGLPYNRFFNFFLERLVVFAHGFSEYIGGVNYFYTDSRCNGCGICSRVCLSQKIKILDKTPVWDKKVLCYMCYACVNFCPKQAAQIKGIPGVVKSYSQTNGRYPHPYATVKALEDQKLRV